MEDGQQDIDQLMAQISALDARLAQASAPLLAQKNQLTKLLAVKQKQQASQVNQQPNQQPGQPPAQQGNQTTTPGSSGAATPGNGQPSRM
jgi:hypothetical protein